MPQGPPIEPMHTKCLGHPGSREDGLGGRAQESGRAVAYLVSNEATSGISSSPSAPPPCCICLRKSGPSCEMMFCSAAPFIMSFSCSDRVQRSIAKMQTFIPFSTRALKEESFHSEVRKDKTLDPYYKARYGMARVVQSEGK